MINRRRFLQLPIIAGIATVVGIKPTSEEEELRKRVIRAGRRSGKSRLTKQQIDYLLGLDCEFHGEVVEATIMDEFKEMDEWCGSFAVAEYVYFNGGVNGVFVPNPDIPGGYIEVAKIRDDRS